MFSIKNLFVSVADKPILKDINLEINPSSIHILMGPNGSGKSTLANSVMGHPSYQLTKGKISLNKKDITKLPPNEKAQAGLFLSLQYPPEIGGITVANFLRTAWQAVKGEKISALDFYRILQKKMALLKLDETFAQRFLNQGFSGGEKKKMEMLQMLVLEPKYAILDETDSGLDIDAIKLIGKVVLHMRKSNKTGFLIITHYNRFLESIKPDSAHIIKKGTIVESGTEKLAKKIDKKGFQDKKL